MKPIIVLMLALLAGCATSPQEVVERGTRFTGEIGKPPLVAAKCIARNAEYFSGSLLASAAEIDADNAELIIRGTIEITTTLSVWRFRKASAGSRYEAWVTPSLLGSPDSHIKLIKGPC